MQRGGVACVARWPGARTGQAGVLGGALVFETMVLRASPVTCCFDRAFSGTGRLGQPVHGALRGVFWPDGRRLNGSEMRRRSAGFGRWPWARAGQTVLGGVPASVGIAPRAGLEANWLDRSCSDRELAGGPVPYVPEGLSGRTGEDRRGGMARGEVAWGAGVCEAAEPRGFAWAGAGDFAAGGAAEAAGAAAQEFSAKILGWGGCWRQAGGVRRVWRGAHWPRRRSSLRRGRRRGLRVSLVLSRGGSGRLRPRGRGRGGGRGR